MKRLVIRISPLDRERLDRVVRVISAVLGREVPRAAIVRELVRRSLDRLEDEITSPEGAAEAARRIELDWVRRGRKETR